MDNVKYVANILLEVLCFLFVVCFTILEWTLTFVGYFVLGFVGGSIVTKAITPSNFHDQG